MSGSYVSSWIKRSALLVGAGALGAAVLVSPAVVAQTSLISPAAAQTVQGPPGFADIVDRVKPAVISVRVKFGANPRTTDDGSSPAPQESPLDRFFRQFGAPDGSSPTVPP